MKYTIFTSNWTLSKPNLTFSKSNWTLFYSDAFKITANIIQIKTSVTYLLENLRKNNHNLSSEKNLIWLCLKFFKAHLGCWVNELFEIL